MPPYSMLVTQGRLLSLALILGDRGKQALINKFRSATQPLSCAISADKSQELRCDGCDRGVATSDLLVSFEFPFENKTDVLLQLERKDAGLPSQSFRFMASSSVLTLV